MIGAIHVVGDYWRDDGQPTELGRLMAAAKDRQDPNALAELRTRIAAQARGLVPIGDPLVVPVPPAADRDAHPVPALADAVADALGVAAVAALSRANATARLRDTPIAQRRALVEAAGYAVDIDVTDRTVVLVDDVVLTTTTLTHLAALLVEAGAAEVVALVACRTRRRNGEPNA